MRKGSIALVLSLTAIAAFIAGIWVAHQGGTKGSDAGGRKILYFVDPMHPAYKSDKPGIAPDCGMQLEPVYADGSVGGAGSGSPAQIPGTVTIDSEKQPAVGVKVGKVEKAAWNSTIRVLGKVVPDEARLYRLNASSELWVRKIYPPTSGSFVRKNDPLLAFYTTNFLSAASSYLYALNTVDRHKAAKTDSSDQMASTSVQVRQAVESLQNLGVSDTQIEEMARTRKMSDLVDVRSPADGIVLARSVTLGMWVGPGTELYRIADLSHVWILADVYENEARFLHPGVSVKITQRNQGKIFGAKVSEVLPQFDPSTRTLKVRLEAENPGYILRPDMFVDLEIPVRMPPSIAIPAQAVLDSGTRKTVFVDRGNGVFEPRVVETGKQLGDRVEIVRGLTPGESIVVSGNFLVDSESRMKLAAAGIYGASHVDPVCSMHVDEGKAKAAGKTVEHGGKTYYFCSDDCVGTFRKEPAKYLKGAGKMAKAESPKPSSAAHGGHEKHAAPAAAGAAKDAPAAESDELPIDPICGMVVPTPEAKAAGRVSVYKGKTYYFCADMCKQRFDGNPEAFLSKPGKSGMGQEGHGEHGKDAHGGHGK